MNRIIAIALMALYFLLIAQVVRACAIKRIILNPRGRKAEVIYSTEIDGDLMETANG